MDSDSMDRYLLSLVTLTGVSIKTGGHSVVSSDSGRRTNVVDN